MENYDLQHKGKFEGKFKGKFDDGNHEAYHNYPFSTFNSQFTKLSIHEIPYSPKNKTGSHSIPECDPHYIF